MLSLLILCLYFQGYSQIIENVDYEIIGDQISVTYDLKKYKACEKYNIELEFVSERGETIIPATVEGDIGLIHGGKRKKIVWHVLRDIQEMEGRYKAVVTITKQVIKMHSVFISPNMPWSFAGLRYTNIKNLGYYVSVASDFGLIEATLHLTGGMVIPVAKRTNIYFGGGGEIFWQEIIVESGVFLKFKSLTIDITGVGINLTDIDYSYSKL